MGNQTSITSSGYEEHQELKKNINKIATKYILSQTFQDMKNLAEHVESNKDGIGANRLTNGCSKLTIFTKDLLDQYLNNRDVAYLFQETHKKESVNIIKEDKLMYIHDDTIQHIKNKKSNLTKKRMCNGIAKYYIDIASIFAAIASSVNINMKKKTSISNEKNILSSSDVVKQMDMLSDQKEHDKRKDDIERANEYTNYCARRIQNIEKLILFDQDPSKNKSDKNKIHIRKSYNQPKDNFLKYNDGLSELDALYYDQYSLNTGKYTSMSPLQKEKYKKDVKLVYTLFHGNTNPTIPFEEMKFKDIVIPEEIVGDSNVTSNIEIEKNNKYFVNMYKAMQEYYNEMQSYKQKLLYNVLFKIFVIRETREGKDEITIRPSLTNDAVQKLKQLTQDTLFNMYIQCEKKYQSILEHYRILLIQIGVDTSYARELEKNKKTNELDKYIVETSSGDKLEKLEKIVENDNKVKSEKPYKNSCKDYYKIQHHEGDEYKYSGLYAIQNILQYDFLMKLDKLENNDIWEETNKDQVNINEMLENGVVRNYLLSSHGKKYETIINDLGMKYDSNFNDLILDNSIDERMILFLLKHHSKLSTTSFQRMDDDSVKQFINGKYGFGMIIKLEKKDTTTERNNYISLLRIDRNESECNQYKYIIFDSRRKEKILMKENEISLIYQDVGHFMENYDYSKLKESIQDDEEYNKKIKEMKIRYERIYRRLNDKKYLILKQKEEYTVPEVVKQEPKVDNVLPEVVKQEPKVDNVLPEVVKQEPKVEVVLPE